MLDIPMLQPTSKIDRSGSPPPKEAEAKSHRDASGDDFDAAYATEANEGTAQPEEDVSSEVEEKPSQELADSEEPNLPMPDYDVVEDIIVDSDGETLDLDVENLEIVTISAGVTTAESSTDKVGPQKIRGGTNEWIFTQSLASGTAETSSPESEPDSAKTIKATENVAGVSSSSTHVPSVGEKVSPIALPSQTVVATTQSNSDVAAPVSKPHRVVETIAQASVQMTAAVVENQRQPPVASPTISPPNSENKSDKRSTDENSNSFSEISARSNPKVAAPSTALASATSQPVMQLTAQQDSSGLDAPLLVNGDAEAPVAWDARSSAAAPNLAQTISRPETPGMIGRQMAEVLQRMPDRPVELALNPEELGRVRLSISAAEGGITVSVLAERPETLDLMRRHIDQLAREFQALGYSSINFAFNEGQSDSGASQQEGSQTGNGSNHLQSEAPAETIEPIKLATTTGVDLRL